MAYFTNSQPKVRQEGFDIPPQHRPPSPSQFDPNNAMFFGHHLYNNVKPNPPTDFADDLVAFMGSSNQDITPRPHNPFDTSTTSNSYRPHNIFDVSSPAPFPHHFSLPATNAAHNATFDTSYSNFRPGSRSRSRSKVDNSNNGGRVQRHKRGSISSSSPRPTSPPPSHHHHHSRPQAILIPPSTGSNHHHHPVSPLSIHMHPHTAPSAWFMDSPFRGGSGTNGTPGDSFRTTDSPFSLPTPDSIPIHHSFSGPGSLPAASPKSVSAKESPPPPQGPDVAAKQAIIASEKRRRRRESHNAVERRRRDNINEKITELATLIPECMLDANGNTLADTAEAFSPDADEKKDSSAPNGASAAGGPVKANKGMILKKSVEYIRYLQQLVNAQATRNRELETQLAASKTGANGNGSAVANSGSSSPSLTSDRKMENNKDAGSSSKETNGNGENNKARSNNATSHPNGHPQFDVNNPSIGPNGEFNLSDMNINLGMNMGMMHNMGMGMNGMNLNVLMGMDIFGQQHPGGIGLLDDPMEGDEEEIEEQDGDDNSPDLDNENDVEESSQGHSSESPITLDGANNNKVRQHARRRSDAIPNGNGTLLGDEEERGRRRVRPGMKEIRVKTEESREEGSMEV